MIVWNQSTSWEGAALQLELQVREKGTAPAAFIGGSTGSSSSGEGKPFGEAKRIEIADLTDALDEVRWLNFIEKDSVAAPTHGARDVLHGRMRLVFRTRLHVQGDTRADDECSRLNPNFTPLVGEVMWQARRPYEIRVTGGQGTTEGHMDTPSCVQISTVREVITVVDSGNNRIQEYGFDDDSFVLSYN